jgi:hypothetical protein
LGSSPRLGGATCIGRRSVSGAFADGGGSAVAARGGAITGGGGEPAGIRGGGAGGAALAPAMGGGGIDGPGRSVGTLTTGRAPAACSALARDGSSPSRR